MARTRTTIIAGNWKMNYGPTEAKRFVKELLPELGKVLYDGVQTLCILCPPTISLAAVRSVLDTLPSSPQNYVELGAQNMYFEERGAFTGEISPTMIRELCSTVILGHSERRMYFDETNELVNKKAQAALQYGLRPIICIGENEEQHEAGQTEQVIHAQVQGCLCNFPKERLQDIVIAYEPIWAIGSGKAATVDDAGRVAQVIRELYCDMYSQEVADALRILYGGSVSSENIYEFMAHPDIDGALVGGASIKLNFVEIVRKVVESA
ncbi:MAG: triose-phosphate isomerase [Ktedonobacteraceae bacterium]